ncbi:MAG: AraC family transcriptional regulator [Nevskia sp.]|nr:AraC family transcriptional regulator [Nevskia sp.]
MMSNNTIGASQRVRFLVGKGYALFEGPSGDNTPHRHAAFQVAIALKGEAAIHDGTRLHSAPVLVVPPFLRHQLQPIARLRTYFVEPHCRFADQLRDACANGIAAMPQLRELREEHIHTLSATASLNVDTRLQQVMDALAAPGDAQPIPTLARQAGLSPQRLRALAQEQLGMPLARWRIWLRFGLAIQLMTTGEGLADAALAAGFADQAHFSRQMREMFGVPPSQLLPLLRAQAFSAT